MKDFFDNMCRTLATPMSRSSALKLIIGGLGSTILAPFGFGQSPCGPNPVTCTGAPNGCCPNHQSCCQTICCLQNQLCCTTGSKPICCPQNSICGTGTNAGRCCTRSPSGLLVC